MTPDAHLKEQNRIFSKMLVLKYEIGKRKSKICGPLDPCIYLDNAALFIAAAECNGALSRSHARISRLFHII